MGELPPAIFGEGVRLEFAAHVRLGRKGRAAAVAKAVKAADAAERTVTKRSRRADRASVARTKRGGFVLRSAETRAEVREFHAQRRLFDVRYDPDVQYDPGADGARGAGRPLI